jgi:hypothetical protein
LDQVQLLSQPARCEVVLAHAALGLQAQPRGLFVVLQEGGGCAAEGGEVARVIQQQPAPVVGDLVLDAADPAGQDRAGLPHRLGHGQAEPFGQALLDDDVGATLQGVDHGPVLLQVVHGQAGQVQSGAGPGGKRGRGPAYLLEDLFALGVVAHRGGRRAGQDQVGAQPVGDVADESLEDAQGILERVPARYLQHDRDSWGDRLILDHLRLADHSARAAVQVAEHRRWEIPVTSVEDPGRLQDGAHRGRRHRLVLGREGIDARRDDGHALAVEAFPAVGGAGEHIGVGRLDVGAQELPCRPGQVIGLIDPDVAAPDDGRPQPLQLGSEPDGLGVVQDHDVARADSLLQLGVGHLEEVLGPLQHHPAGLDAGAGQVAEQEVQHLGAAAALLGRVHVPHAPAGEPIGRLRQPVREATGRLGLEHAVEPSRVKLLDADFLHRVPPSTQSRTLRLTSGTRWEPGPGRGRCAT